MQAAASGKSAPATRLPSVEQGDTIDLRHRQPNAVHADKRFDPVQRGPATKIRPLSTATAFQIIPSLLAAATSFGSACATEPNSARGSGDEKRFHGACSPNPSSTILPLARPLSSSAWARFRLAALIAPKR